MICHVYSHTPSPEGERGSYLRAHSQSANDYTGPEKWFGLEAKKYSGEVEGVSVNGAHESPSEMSGGDKNGSHRSVGQRERDKERVRERQRDKDTERSLGNSRNRYREYRAMSELNSARGKTRSSRERDGYAEQKDAYDPHGIHLNGRDRESVAPLSRTQSIDYDRNLSNLASFPAFHDSQARQPLSLSIPEVEARVLHSLSARRLYKFSPYQSPYGPEQTSEAFRYEDENQDPQSGGPDGESEGWNGDATTSMPVPIRGASSPSSLQASSAPSPPLPTSSSALPHFILPPSTYSHSLSSSAPKATLSRTFEPAVPMTRTQSNTQSQMQRQQPQSKPRSATVAVSTPPFSASSSISIAHSVPHSTATSVVSEHHIYPHPCIHQYTHSQDYGQVQGHPLSRSRSESLPATKSSSPSVSVQPSPVRSINLLTAFPKTHTETFSEHQPVKPSWEVPQLEQEAQEEKQLSDYLRWLGTQSQPVKSDGEE